MLVIHGTKARSNFYYWPYLYLHIHYVGTVIEIYCIFIKNQFIFSYNFQDAFKAFSKFGDSKSDGKHITLSQSDKWMKQAKVIDGKKITTTDTAIHFKKLKSLKVGLEDYQKFLDDLAKSKKIELEEIKKKLTTCGHPGITSLVSNFHLKPASHTTSILN